MTRTRRLCTSFAMVVVTAGATAVTAPAGTITLSGSSPNQTLTFTATGGETNSLVLQTSGGNYTLSDAQAITGSTSCSGEGSTTVTCANGSVDIVVLDLGDQNDLVEIRQIEDVLTINGGSGADQVTLGGASITANGIRQAVTFNGNADADALIATDTSDPNGSITTVTATSVGAGGSDTFFGVGGSAAYSGVEAVTVNFGGGGDNIRVLATTATGGTTLDAGGGNDVFAVSSDGNGTSGNLDGIAAPLALLGGSGANALLLSDETAAAANAATISPTAISGLAPVTVAFSASGSFGGGVVVRASETAADNVAVTGTPPGSSVDVRTLGGNDTVLVSSDGSGVGGDLDGLGGSLSIDLGSGLNTLSLSDAGETTPGANAAVVLDGDSIDGLGGPSDSASIGYLATEGTIVTLAVTTSASAAVSDQLSVTNPGGPLNLTLGDGADTVDVRASSRTVTVALGGGDDTATVGGDANGADAIAAPISIDGGPGTDALTVDDTADSSADTVTLTESSVAAGVTDSLFASGGTIQYADVASLTVRAGSGNDAIAVASTAPGVVTTVAGGGGDDAFALGAGASVEAIRSAVSLDGGDGINTLTVNDSSDTSSDAVTISSVTVGAGPGDSFFGPGGSLAQTGMFAMTLTTGSGNEAVRISGDPVATLLLGQGDDRLALEAGASVGGTLDGQAGSDTLDFAAWTASVFVDLGSGEASGTSGVSGFERVEGGAGHDTLAGQYAAPSELIGRAGNDKLSGGSEADVLDGGPGDDQLGGSFGGDRYLLGGGGSDRATDNAGKDTLDFGRAAKGVVVDIGLGRGQPQKLGKGKTTLRLFGQFENVSGSRHADVISGNGAANTLLGAAGNDTISGRRGDDLIDGGAGSDAISESADTSFTLTPTSLTGVGRDTLRRIERADLTGGVSANRIVASTFRGRARLAGGPGNDTLTGGSGPDLLLGDDGDDRIEGGLGLDQALGGPGSDTLVVRDGKRDFADGGESYDVCVCDAEDLLINLESSR